MIVTVTGGAGYIGVGVVEELLAAALEVRVLDSLLHRPGDGRARHREGRRAHRRRGGARPRALRLRLDVLQLRSHDDPTVPIDEGGELRPVSLYAEQKVIVERRLLETDDLRLHPTCLRFATIFGAAPRMRFDLTVNEFTRDLWAGRELEVYGELFWRPYVHVREAARAVLAVLQAPEGTVGGEVFNVGHSDDNFRKLDLANLITDHLGRGTVSYVQRTDDPRDYKVSFEKIRSTLGFEPARRVPDGITEIVAGLERGEFGDPFSPSYRN